ncbi:MAG: neutral/alkaline non-lysosomal ceramidase N-terminal domain-containing protein [Terriglobia bacterium]
MTSVVRWQWLWFVVACMAACSAAYAGELRAGFATVDITPPLNREMAGFGPYLERKATTIHDPLMAHAVVLETGGQRIAIVGCDVLAVSRDFTEKVRFEAEAGTGIPGPHIMVSATHTHSGPAIPRLIGWGEQDKEYLSKLPGMVAGAIVEASKHLQSVELYYGEVPVEGIGQNREYPGGPIDKTLRVLKFMHGDKLVGFIVHHSVHNVIFSEQMHAYTSELTGVAIAKVVKEHPGSVGIYLQGSCGDINPARFENNFPPDQCVQLLEQLSDHFADYVREALKNASKKRVDRIEMDTREISLPLVPTDRALILRQMQLADQLLGSSTQGTAFFPTGSKGEPPLPPTAERWVRFTRDTSRAVYERFNRLPLTEKQTEIQALRVQDVLILADPGEVFISLADQVSQMLPGWKVWVTGYSNDYVGYIPTPDRYALVSKEKFNYPAYFVPLILGDFRLSDDIGDVLVRNLVRLGESVVQTDNSKSEPNSPAR